MTQNDAFLPSGTEDVLDASTMRQLLDLDDGKSGLIEEMYQLLLEDTPPRIANMEKALLAGRNQEMGDLAHAVKGAASTMGLLKVRTLALALETLGRTGQGSEPADALLARLKTEYDHAQEALKVFIASRKA